MSLPNITDIAGEVALEKGFPVEVQDDLVYFRVDACAVPVNVTVFGTSWLETPIISLVAEFHAQNHEYSSDTCDLCLAASVQGMHGRFFCVSQDNQERPYVLLYRNVQLLLQNCDHKEVIGGLIELMIKEINVHWPIILKTIEGSRFEEVMPFLALIEEFPSIPNA